MRVHVQPLSGGFLLPGLSSSAPELLHSKYSDSFTPDLNVFPKHRLKKRGSASHEERFYYTCYRR